MSSLKKIKYSAFSILATIVLSACGGGGGDSDSSDDSVSNNETGAGTLGVLHNAFADFTGNITAVLDGDEVVLEATGIPNHTSVYWNPNNSSGLYVEADPSITTVSQMSPGFIEDYNNLYTLRVSTAPSLATSPSATSLGPIGLSVSGAPIFNDQEGNGALSGGVLAGLDRNGAHTGPETYHYHLEPKAITDDDNALVGVMSDGFFLYGRRDNISNEYPTDLDASGGHVGVTQHSNGVPEYHYHIVNEIFTGTFYLVMGQDLQGTPAQINR